jgi:hypothetical protein
VEPGEKVSTAVHDVAPRQSCRKRWQLTDLQASRQELNDCELLFSWLLQSWYALACLAVSSFSSYLSRLIIVYVTSKYNSDEILTIFKPLFFSKLIDYHETQYTRYAIWSHHGPLFFLISPQSVIRTWRKRKFEDESHTVCLKILRRKGTLIWDPFGAASFNRWTTGTVYSGFFRLAVGLAWSRK